MLWLTTNFKNLKHISLHLLGNSNFDAVAESMVKKLFLNSKSSIKAFEIKCYNAFKLWEIS